MFEGKDESACRQKLDSVFSTFPYISVADKYVYYFLVEYCLREANKYERCLAITDTLVNIIEEAGLKKEMLKEYVNVLDEKIWYYFQMKKINTAIETIVEKKNLGGPDSLQSLLSGNYRDLAYWALGQSKFEEAIKYFKLSLVYIDYCRPLWILYRRRYSALSDIGIMFQRLGRYDSALHYHQMAEKFVNENYEMLRYPGEDTLFRFAALQSIYDDYAEVYFRTGDLDKAIFFNKKAIAVSNNELKSRDTHLVQDFLLESQAYIWYKKGDISRADSICQLLEKNNDSTGHLFRIKLLQLQSSIDSLQGNHSKRISNLKELIVLQDQETSKTIAAFRNDPLIYYEATEKKREIAVKDKDVRLRQTKSNAAILAGSLLALLAISLFFNLRKIRQVMRKLKKTMLETELQQKQKEEEQLRFEELRLQAKYQEAVARQRQEISNDLHDSLSGSLVALKYLIEDIKKNNPQKGLQKALDDIGAEVDSIYIAAREYMHNLNAGETITQHDLPGLLKDMAGRYAGNTSFTISLDIDKDGISSKLSLYQQDQLYYIIKEAVSNTMKYANATGIKINIGFTGSYCNFSVTDNGEGFDTKKQSRGLGLDSMQSRIGDLDGEISIISGRQGTIIKGSFPADDMKQDKENVLFSPVSRGD